MVTLSMWYEIKRRADHRSMPASIFVCLQLYGYGLDFRVLLQAVFAKLTANAGLLESAERSGCVKHVIAVHPDCTRADAVGDGVRLADVARPDAGGQAVHGFVGALHELVNVLEFQDRHDRAKDFLLGNGHVIFYVGKYGGADKITALTYAITTGHQLCAFFLAGLNVAHDLLELRVVNLRALLGGRVQRIAHGTFLGAGGAAFHKFVIAFFFHVRTRTGAATLTLVEEEGKVRAFNRGVHVGIGKSDVWALAAQLQRYALEVGLGRSFHNQVADFGRSGKGDLVHVHVACKRSTGGGAVAGKNVDHSRREAGFKNQFANAQSGKRRLLGGFQDDGVAGSQRGCQLPGLHEQREVPRND